MIPALSAVFALALTVVSIAVGERVRRCARVPLAPALRLPVAYLLGCWLLASVLLVLGLVRLLLPAIVIGAVVLLALGGRWHGRRYRWGGAAAAAAGGAMLVPVALAPPFFYDALVYHLALPWQALLELRWAPHPEDLFSTSPPLSQLLALPSLALGLERAPAMQHLLAAVIAGAAVWALGRSLGAPRWSAALAAASAPLLPSHAAVAGLPTAEAWAWACLAAALAVVVGPRVRPGGPLLAGLLAGTACAARIQAIPLALLVIAAVVVRRPSWSAAWKAGGGLLLGATPWWLKNLLLLGAPMAPIGWSVAGVAELRRDAVSVLQLAGSPAEAMNIVVGALASHAAYLLPLALGVLLAALDRDHRRVRIAAVVACGGFFGWAAVGAVPRYLGATLIVALAVVAALAASRPGSLVAGLVLGTVVALSFTFSLLEVRRLGGLRLLTTPAATVQRFWVVNNPLPAYAAASSLPAEARLLLVGEPRGYGLQRQFASPSYYDASPLRGLMESDRTPLEVRESLCTAGFTHLLINQGELDRLVGGYPVAPWRSETGWHRWEVFLYWLGGPELTCDRVEIYALGCAAGPELRDPR